MAVELKVEPLDCRPKYGFVLSISKLSVDHMLGYDKVGLKWRSRIKIDDFIFHVGIGSYRLPLHHLC